MRLSRQETIDLIESIPDSLHALRRAMAALKVVDPEDLTFCARHLLAAAATPDFTRLHICRILLEFLPLESVGVLVSFLDHPESIVRWDAAGLLSNVNDRSAVEPLIRVLKHDSDATVRQAAAFSLGRIGDRRALPALGEAAVSDFGEDYEGRTVSSVARGAIEDIEAENTGHR